MRRSDHPSRPSAMTCCFFSSLKTLLTLTEGNPHVRLNVLGSTPLAGFQVILIGRFWVIPEVAGAGSAVCVARSGVPPQPYAAAESRTRTPESADRCLLGSHARSECIS